MAQSTRLMNFRSVMGKMEQRRTKIYTLMKEEGFPKPLDLPSRTNLWSESDIDEWIESYKEKKNESK